jgi:hypothetical protein
MRRTALVVLMSSMIGAACGGSSYSTTPVIPTNLVTNGTFTATVNGTAWGALGRVIVTHPTANSVAMSAPSATYAFVFALLNVTGPTTVSLVSAPSNGSQVTIGSAGQGGWSTGQAGGTGSVVITALTATHIAGTFSFDAPPVSGSGILHVTNGAFDLTY